MADTSPYVEYAMAVGDVVTPLDSSKLWLRTMMTDETDRFAPVTMRMNGVPDFETLNQCRARQKKLRRHLKKIGALKLTRRLSKCGPHKCGLNRCRAGCWFACRTYRAQTVPQLAPLMAANGGSPYFITIAGRPNWSHPINQLNKCKPESLLQWVDRRLKKLDAALLGISAVEVVLDVDGNGKLFWAAHLHLVLVGASQEQLQRVLQVRASERKSNSKPVQIKLVTCLGRALAYTTKRLSQQRLPYRDATGRHNRRNVPLKAQAQIELDRWLLRLSIGDRFRLIGCRKNGKIIEALKGQNDNATERVQTRKPKKKTEIP